MSDGHSRYPVLDDDDQVVGVVHLQDLLAAPQREGVVVTTLMRDALLVPTTMSLPDALTALAETRNQLACVLDEYGGFVGVLSAEDLAEELVGEITDEHDDASEAVAVSEPDGTWLLPGDLPLDEVERTIGSSLPGDDYETLAGLATAVHGALPEVGTLIEVELPLDLGDLADDEDPAPRHLHLEVLELERHVPSRLRLVLDDAAHATATTTGEESR
jgi:CBS domain containing-hemolysin-like protein